MIGGGSSGVRLFGGLVAQWCGWSAARADDDSRVAVAGITVLRRLRALNYIHH